jgi:hypothetical protein
MGIKKVDPGTVIFSEGVEYIFGQASAQAFNAWVDIVNNGFPADRELGEIHLYEKNGEGSVFLTHQQIAQSLIAAK